MQLRKLPKRGIFYKDVPRKRRKSNISTSHNRHCMAILTIPLYGAEERINNASGFIYEVRKGC